MVKRNGKNANGNNNNRRGANHNVSRTVTHGDEVVQRLKLRRLLLQKFDTITGADLHSRTHIAESLGDYNQSEKLCDVYEQYAFENIKVYCKMSGKGNADHLSMRTLNSMKCTTLYAAVDYDVIDTPAFNDILMYDNLCTNTLNGEWKLIADYKPRIGADASVASPVGPLVLNPNSTWIDTRDPTIIHTGCVIASVMSGGSQWFTTSSQTNSAMYQVQIVSTMKFRGRRRVTL